MRKKQGKLRNLGSSQAAILKCKLFDGFISKHSANLNAHKGFPFTAPLFNHPS